jgi:hypothetical protein
VLLRLAGVCSISEKAAFTRFQRCGEWLWRLCGHLYRNNKAIIEATQCGSGKADCWPCCVGWLFDLGDEGNGVDRRGNRREGGQFQELRGGNLVIEYRGYCGKQGIECLLEGT